MKTMVKINGKEMWYNLERVHWLSEVETGQFIIVKHPMTHELCRAEIRVRYDNGIEVREADDRITPFRWFIPKRSLFNQVFLITKQYKGGK